MKYNKSKIMKKANALHRIYDMSKSESLKTAWAEAKAEVINEMNFSEMVKSFEEKKILIAKLQAEQDMLKNGIIDYMNGREEIEESGYRVRYITVIRNILDTPKFKSENRELYELYLKENESKRFTVTA